MLSVEDEVDVDFQPIDTSAGEQRLLECILSENSSRGRASRVAVSLRERWDSGVLEQIEAAVNRGEPVDVVERMANSAGLHQPVQLRSGTEPRLAKVPCMETKSSQTSGSSSYPVNATDDASAMTTDIESYPHIFSRLADGFIQIDAETSSCMAQRDFSLWHRFLGVFASIETMASAHPVYDATKVFLRQVHTADILPFYGHFTRADLLMIGGLHSALYLAKSWSKAELETKLMSHDAACGECASLCYVFKALPRARAATVQGMQKICDPVVVELKRKKEKEKELTAMRNREMLRRKREGQTLEKDRKMQESRDEFPHVADMSLKRQITEDVRVSMSVETHRKKPCAVCGEDNLCDNLNEVPATEVDFSLLSNDRIPDDLLPTEYDALEYDRAILQPQALKNFGKPDASMMMCRSCEKSLTNGKKPAAALANGYYFAIPRLPPDVAQAFQSASVFDLLMVARVRGNTLTYKYSEKPASSVYGHPRAQSQTYMRGNLMVMPQDTLSLRNVLPPPPDDIRKSMVVLFTGHGNAKVSKEKLARFQPVLVSSGIVRTLIEFLVEKNRSYRAIDGEFVTPATLNEANLTSLVSPEDQHKEKAVPASLVIGALKVEDEGVASGTAGYINREDFQEGGRPDDILVDAVTWSETDPTNDNYRKMKYRALRWAKEGNAYARSRTGTGLVRDFDNPHLLAWMWPQLDPFGLGGFGNECRDIPVDMRAQVAHLLRLHDSPFARDPTFAFTCYNILRKREVYRSIRFRVKAGEQKRILDDLMHIEPSVLQALEERYLRDNNYVPKNDDEKRVVRTLKKLNFVVGDLPGTAGYKLRCRNEIRSMVYSLSTPALFGTLNPFDLAHPLVHLLAGHEITLDDAVKGNWELDSFKRAVTVAKNPGAAAAFFHIAVKSFIEDVLRYGKDEEGLFGRCTGYYGMVETQGRGTLHLHILVWLEGNLSPQALRDKMSSDPQYKARLFDWLEDIIKNHLPGQTEIATEPEGKPLAKPGHGLTIDPRLQEIPSTAHLTDDEFMSAVNDTATALVKEVSWHEHTLTCWKYLKPWEPRDDAHCRMRIDGSTQLHSDVDEESGSILLKRLHPRINSHNDLITYWYRCNSDWKYIGSGELAKALVYYMTDYMTKLELPMHVSLAALSYAIKAYGEEIEGQPDTYDADCKKLITKSVNAIMSKAETSQAEVMTDLLSYGMHYTSQTFRLLYWGAFDRLFKRWFPDSDDGDCSEGVDDLPSYIAELEEVNGEGEVATCTTGKTSYNPVNDEDTDPTPREPEDDDDSGNVNGAGKSVANEVPVFLNFDKETVTASNQQDDYMYRSRDAFANDLCLWDFVCTVEKVPLSYERRRVAKVAGRARVPGKTPQPRGTLDPKHNQHEKFIQRLRECALTPTVLGPSPPHDNSTEEEYEMWCRMMLILFKSWRSPRDLKSKGESWTAAFGRTEFPDCLRRVMKGFNVMRECEEARDEHRRQRQADRRMHPPFFAGEDDPSADLQRFFEKAVLSDDRLDDALEDEYGDDRDPTSLEKQSTEVKAILALAQAGLFKPRDRQELHVGEDYVKEATAMDRVRITQLEKMMAILKRKRRPADQADDTSDEDEDDDLDADQNPRKKRRTDAVPVLSIETVQDRAENSQAVPDGGFSGPLQRNEFDKIVRAVVKEHKLSQNAEQCRAFLTVADHFYGDLRGLPQDQLIMHVGGIAGSGKSHVIKAIVELFKRCAASDRILLGAPTGIAAVLIQGYTVHALTFLPGSLQEINIETLQAIWQHVRYWIIDEVSMLGARLMSKLSKRLRIALGDSANESLPFGGMNVVFFGDLGQLKPVKDKRLFDHGLVRDMRTHTAQSIAGQTSLHGAFIWRQLNEVVLLKKNIRQTTDAKYANLLARIRLGKAWNGIKPMTIEQRGPPGSANYSTSDYNTLNDRRMDIIATHAPEKLEAFRDAPIIVKHRKLRDIINLNKARSFADSTHQTLHLYYSKDAVNRGRTRLTGEAQRRAWNISSTFTKDSLGVLPLVPGMKVMITENVAISKGAVNGAEGTVREIQYEVIDGVRYLLMVLVHIPGSKLSGYGLGEDVVPIAPVATSFTYDAGDGSGSHTIRRIQEPLMPAYAYTDHKSQGRSLKVAIVDLRGTTLESAYVMLSRPQAEEGLLIMGQFRPHTLNSRLNQDTREEFDRLERLDALNEKKYSERIMNT